VKTSPGQFPHFFTNPFLIYSPEKLPSYSRSGRVSGARMD
jgi:hypothetical protein